MRIPTIDETRAIVMIIGAITFAVIVVYFVLTGQATENFILMVMAALLGVDRGVEGAVMVKRNSSGKQWGDAPGEKQDQLPKR